MSFNLETMRYVHRHVIPTAFALLPSAMGSLRAHAMLLATGLQESKFHHRLQQPVGPARSFWQFEKIGVRGVLEHPRSAPVLVPVLDLLRYPDSADACYTAIMHHDVLACVFARLLLWTLPASLPDSMQSQRGWQQYLQAWRPGKPHPETWDFYFSEAWRMLPPIPTKE